MIQRVGMDLRVSYKVVVRSLHPFQPAWEPISHVGTFFLSLLQNQPHQDLQEGMIVVLKKVMKSTTTKLERGLHSAKHWHIFFQILLRPTCYFISLNSKNTPTAWSKKDFKGDTWLFLEKLQVILGAGQEGDPWSMGSPGIEIKSGALPCEDIRNSKRTFIEDAELGTIN